MEKVRVGILGATGMVGQRYISLLENHPWFEVISVSASPSSAGKQYYEAVSGRWHLDSDIPKKVRELIVKDANDVSSVAKDCTFVFSALEMDKQSVGRLEAEYAAANIPVVSNTSAHRSTEDVPMIIPEINYSHIDLVETQRKNRGWEQGFIVVKPNCSIQSYLTPVYSLIKAGYDVKRLIVTTLQAISGAGHPGVTSLDIIENVIPYISGEEQKTEEEPLKILGTFSNGSIIPRSDLSISAHCNRVPVIDGHMACVSLGFSDSKPNSLDEVIDIWNSFKSVPQDLNLPYAPLQPIIYRTESDRPQPRKDRDADKGMAISVGRLRKCSVLDLRFVGLSHNTLRGAAGGGILNAELLYSKGYIVS